MCAPCGSNGSLTLPIDEVLRPAPRCAGPHEDSAFFNGLLAGAFRTFTAFGEPIAGPTDRFGYVGAWGYQQHGEMPFLHVGHRYYDPASGRFLQRDPIGIGGGRNVYAYVASRASSRIDPSGLQFEAPGMYPIWPFPPPPPPKEPVAESPKDIQEDLRDINNARTAVKGGAAITGIILACIPPAWPYAAAVGIGLAINEIVEEWE